MNRGTWTVAMTLIAVACGGPRVDTRTFELKHLRGGEAGEMLRPYVFTDREGAPGLITSNISSVTVRETPDNLEKIARVLAEFDKPKPSVRLYFQIIDADGAASSDPAIKEVETVLRKLFRFKGYRLLAEAVVGGIAESDATQVVAGTGGPYVINAVIHDVRGTGDSGSVRIRASLTIPRFRVGPGPILETVVTLRPGQTAVLGNAQVSEAGRTIILTVKPELVTP